MEDSGTASSALLLLVRRGQGLVAELFRLSDTIPPVFFVDTDETYAEILPDFRYFKAPEFYDSQLEPDPRLMEMEDDFRESHMPVLERFFQLFGRIVRYYYNLLRFIEDLKEGLYIQQSLDGMLADSEGKQLMIEAAYLHGTLLLLLDLRIDTKVKEIIVVCYYRYKVWRT
jgi:WASH complex subunit strumpellin